MRDRHILVTRPTEQAHELCGLLAANGLEPIVVPTVAIDTAPAARDLDLMIGRLERADWLVLTSANGARALAHRLDGRVLPANLRVAAVGPATARVLENAGVHVDHMPDEFLTVAIAEGLGPLAGRRVVLARADAASPELRAALLACGATVEEVVAYRTIEGPASSRDALQAALHAPLAGIAFTSGSTVRGLMRLASTVDRRRARAFPAFCIGPVTADAARSRGFDVAVVAADHTARGLADAITTHLTGKDR